MDPYRLLSRSTKLSGRLVESNQRHASRTPSSGEVSQPQHFPTAKVEDLAATKRAKKRKRGQESEEISKELNFFDDPRSRSKPDDSHGSRSRTEDQLNEQNTHDEGDNFNRTEDKEPGPVNRRCSALSLDETKKVLARHKIKTFWLNPVFPEKKRRRKNADEKGGKLEGSQKIQIHPSPLLKFHELRERFGISRTLATNIQNEGYSVPTEVQLGAIALLLDGTKSFEATQGASKVLESDVDLLAVAPTGSGKTLAFMIPLLHKIKSRRFAEKPTKTTSAIILCPTKELAAQIVNEGRKLSLNLGIRISLVRKGMRFPSSNDSGTGIEEQAEATVVKSDILVSTPGLLLSICQETVDSAPATLSQVQHLVLDEADVLLDPLFREQTTSIWKLLNNPDLRVSLWSATMGSNIEELARTMITDRRDNVSAEAIDVVRSAPLVRLVVGLKDSAVPNVQHRLVYAASEQGKLMGLRQLLHPAVTSSETGPPLLPPFLVFTQTVERAIALHSELRYDVPAEAGGISRIAVLHSDLSDAARDSVMTRFRKGEIWVLITTDLLSRGVDFRGVNGVVNYDIPTSSAAYVHRVGRTGRAGREGGVAVTLYTKEDVTYLKPIANIISAAQKQRSGSSGVESEKGVQQWLLDALPNLNKKTKEHLRKRGVESRTTRGKIKDPKGARRAKISTKAGFLRREENKRAGAISGSKRRKLDAEGASDDDGAPTDFVGFD